MTAVITSAICASEFAKLKIAIEDWSNDDSKKFDVSYAGGTVKAFSRDLEDAVEYFLNATADAGKTVDVDARESVMAIDSFCAHYEEFKRLAAEESPYAPPSGSTELWSSWSNLCDHFLTRPNYPKPQAIKTLIEQKVGQMQIATIYGWFTDNGAPDVEKVADELAKPGTHYKPDEWQHPAKASKRRIVDAAWKTRRSSREANFETKSDLETMGKFVPPSLDEMVQAGAPAKQISNVHRISVEEAEQLLIEAGTNPKREIVPANAQVAHLERMMAESSPTAPVPPVPKPSRAGSQPTPQPTASKLLQEV